MLELDPHGTAAQWFHLPAAWDHRGWTAVVGFGTHAQSGMLQNCHHPHIVISDTTEGKQRRYEGVQHRDHSSKCARAAPLWAASEDGERKELQASGLLKKCRIWNEASKGSQSVSTNTSYLTSNWPSTNPPENTRLLCQGTALAAQALLLPFLPPYSVSLACSPQEEAWSRPAAGNTQEGSSSSYSAAPQPSQGFTLHWHSISPWQVVKQPSDYSQPPSGAKSKCVIAHLCKAGSQIWKYFYVIKDKNKFTALRD